VYLHALANLKTSATAIYPAVSIHTKRTQTLEGVEKK